MPTFEELRVSIPLEQGGVFRLTTNTTRIALIHVSIPLEQGGVFRQYMMFDLHGLIRLNPFGTGRGLSTSVKVLNKFFPLRSQSLWNRAGSFDLLKRTFGKYFEESQSLWNRAGSFDLSIKALRRILKSVSIPLEQGGVFRQSSRRQRLYFTFVSIPLEQGGVFRLQGWFGALMDKAWEDRFPIFSLMRKVRYEFD